MSETQRVKVLCTPQFPNEKTTLSTILKALDVELVRPESSEADLVIFWEDATFKRSRELPVARWGVPPINSRCLDISKHRVDGTHLQVFGYALQIDPLTYDGPCIEKSNLNALHDAREVQCPGTSPQRRKVYQRLVDISTDDGSLEEIRIPVVGSEIPFCWRKLRRPEPLPQRIQGGYARSLPVPTRQLLTADEETLILRLCAALGLDFAELDAGRDRADGRLYVFDANSTPFSPRSSCTDEDKRSSVELLAAAFARQFGPVISPPAGTSIPLSFSRISFESAFVRE